MGDWVCNGLEEEYAPHKRWTLLLPSFWKKMRQEILSTHMKVVYLRVSELALSASLTALFSLLPGIECYTAAIFIELFEASPHQCLCIESANKQHLSFMKKISEWILRLTRYVAEGVWESAEKPVVRLVNALARRLIVTTRCFLHDQTSFTASALTYSTLFSFVPLLAVVLGIAGGFGLREIIERLIRDNLVAEPAFIDTLLGFVNSYLSRTSGGLFVGFGLLVLLWTLVNLTGSIEDAFNRIWHVEKPRTLYRKITDYTAVFFLLPIFVTVILGLTIYIYAFVNGMAPSQQVLKPFVVLLLKCLPLFLLCVFFVGLNLFVPNTRVRWKSALKAGIPTALVFQLLQYFYVNSQVWLSSYNAIYGSFAALPLFMLMCQIAWMITLYGATFCYVDQHITHFYYGRDSLRLSPRYRDFLAIELTRVACSRFHEEKPPMSATSLAEHTKCNILAVNALLSELCKAGILMEVAGEKKDEDPVYIPAVDIHHITCARLLQAVDQVGDEPSVPLSERWNAYCRQRSQAFGTVLPDIPLHEAGSEWLSHSSLPPAKSER